MKYFFSLSYRLIIPLIFTVMILYTAKINWKNGQWEHVIEADGKGYYAYLPAVFIYHDLNFGFFEYAEITHSYNPTIFFEYRYTFKGKKVNKFFAGEALLLSPFFLAAHSIVTLTSGPADGYSRLYIIFLTIAAVFYLCTGLYYLRKTLTLYQFQPFSIAVVLIALLTGTHLFYYTVGEPSLSHVFSFAGVSCFIYFLKKSILSPTLPDFIVMCIALGIIILIRPVNGIVVLCLLFLSKDYSKLIWFFKFLLKNKIYLSLLVFIPLSIAGIQLIIYYIQTGHFWVYSYAKEGFNFGNPQIINFLFSFRKGFFLYTPLAALSLSGLYCIRRNRFEAFSFALFMGMVVYVLSSWWNWYYGGSFSARPMVEFLPFFGILLGYWVDYLTSLKWKIPALGIIFALILLNQIQTLQYRYYIIHWSEMNKEKYIRSLYGIPEFLQNKKAAPASAH